MCGNLVHVSMTKPREFPCKDEIYYQMGDQSWNCQKHAENLTHTAWKQLKHAYTG